MYYSSHNVAYLIWTNIFEMLNKSKKEKKIKIKSFWKTNVPHISYILPVLCVYFSFFFDSIIVSVSIFLSRLPVFISLFRGICSTLAEKQKLRKNEREIMYGFARAKTKINKHYLLFMNVCECHASERIYGLFICRFSKEFS